MSFLTFAKVFQKLSTWELPFLDYSISQIEQWKVNEDAKPVVKLGSASLLIAFMYVKFGSESLHSTSQSWQWAGTRKDGNMTLV